MRYAKIASNLHSNPKVFAAGADGREVYIWVLLKNAELELEGVVPASYLEPVYLSQQLQRHVTNVTAVTASVEACVRVRLLERLKDGAFRIVGWDDEWSPAKSGSARAKAYRERKRAAAVTERNVTVRDGRDAHVGEERRREEKRVERGGRKRPETPYPPDWRPNPEAEKLATELGLNAKAEATAFRDRHLAIGSMFRDWDAAFRTWLRNARKFAERDGRLPSTAPAKPYIPGGGKLKLLGEPEGAR